MLTPEKTLIANNTISAYAFYYMAIDALETGRSLSTVRMGDGERTILEEITNTEMEIPLTCYDDAWHQRMGTFGISKMELYSRLMYAGNQCSHFAPSVSGLVHSTFDLYSYFDPRDRYLDNFFVNIWGDPYKALLFKAAGHVLFIHRNRATADAIQKRARTYFDVKVTYLEMSKWQESEDIIDKAVETDARLVLFSGGPASKYISPRIAEQSKVPKVVLDIGNSVDQWTFLNYTP